MAGRQPNLAACTWYKAARDSRFPSWPHLHPVSNKASSRAVKDYEHIFNMSNGPKQNPHGLQQNTMTLQRATCVSNRLGLQAIKVLLQKLDQISSELEKQCPEQSTEALHDPSESAAIDDTIDLLGLLLEKIVIFLLEYASNESSTRPKGGNRQHTLISLPSEGISELMKQYRSKVAVLNSQNNISSDIPEFFNRVVAQVEEILPIISHISEEEESIDDSTLDASRTLEYLVSKARSEDEDTQPTNLLSLSGHPLEWRIDTLIVAHMTRVQIKESKEIPQLPMSRQMSTISTSPQG
ncbi:hypothetical protein GGI35DRAFT_463508 [Trichoderma velutinum]